MLQSRKVLGFITAEHRETFLSLGKECCSYANTSGLMEQDMHMLKDMQRDLRARSLPTTPPPRDSNPFVACLLPLLGPLLAIRALFLLTPCLVQFLQLQISTIAKITANWVLVEYQAIPSTEAEGYNDTSPL